MPFTTIQSSNVGKLLKFRLSSLMQKHSIENFRLIAYGKFSKIVTS